MHHPMWNQLPYLFRQPHTVHSPRGSPHPAHVTSSQPSPSLSQSVTPSAFYSRLKTSLSQILSCTVFLVLFGLPSRIFEHEHVYRTKLALAFVCFSFFFLYFFASGYVLQLFSQR